MAIRRYALFITTLLILVVTAAGGAIAATPMPPPLRLHYGDLPTADQRAVLNALPAPADRLIVQFRGPVGAAERAALEASVATILEYLPDYAYLIAGSPQQLAAVAAIPDLARAMPAPAALQLDLSLLRALAAGSGTQPVRLAAWPGREAQLAAELAAAGLNPAAALSAAQLRQLASLSSLRWAEPASRPQLLNDVERNIMNVETGPWQSSGLYGTGQILAVADSGLDTGNPATLSPDFAGRLIASHILSPTGDLEDENGHGTHVAGSALGSGVRSGANPAADQYAGSFAGVAPRAGLVYQAFEADPQGRVYGLPDDYYQLFAQAYQSGARLHTNSWGDYTGPISDPESQFGGYPYGSQRTDSFVWDNPDMTIFVAAGNSGSDGTPGNLGFCTGGDGVVDPDSLLSPATAKNVITVGASESERLSGGLATYPWLLLSFCFGTAPIATDPLSNNPNGMAAFSSRGPTDDGRIKPDLVAPGTNVVSSRSGAPGAGTLWGVHETNTNYVYSSGTSMATPLAAGAGVLAREWLARSGIANPSAALVKAVLLNTAANIAPGQYGVGATQEIPDTWPNSVAGWGRTDLGFLAAPAPFAIWYDDRSAGLTTDASVTYNHSSERSLQVTSSDLPLRVHLVWTDPPASLAAAQQLVNDLDLTLTGPNGTIYRGNGSAAGDRINNVEGILLSNPPVGTYSIQVRGFNVPIDSQPYALVVSGPINAAAQVQTISFPTPSGVRYGDAPVTLNAVAGSGLPVSYQVISGPASVSGANLTINGAGEMTVRAIQAGGSGYLPAQQDVTFTVAKAPLTITADNLVRKVGLANPPLTLRYSGFVNGDDPADLDLAPTASTTATAESPSGEYPITVSGGADANYSFSYVAGTLRVTTKDIPTLSWDVPAAISYGVALSAAQLNATARFNDAPLAGSYSYNPPAGTRLIAGDHQLHVTFIPTDEAAFERVDLTVPLRVERALLVIVPEDTQIVVGEPMPELTARYSGFVNGETVADLDSPPQLSTTATATSPPGDYPISASGAADANYTITTVEGRLRILPQSNPAMEYRLYLPLL